jgi:hypothetical protein
MIIGQTDSEKYKIERERLHILNVRLDVLIIDKVQMKNNQSNLEREQLVTY